MEGPHALGHKSENLGRRLLNDQFRPDGCKGGAHREATHPRGAVMIFFFFK
jgi:hypothetical protein